MTKEEQDKISAAAKELINENLADFDKVNAIYKKALDIEGVLVFRSAERSFASSHGKSGIYRNILEFIASVCKGLTQYFRNRGAALNVNAVAGVYQTYGFGG